jgi:hypothetical protein
MPSMIFRQFFVGALLAPFFAMAAPELGLRELKFEDLSALRQTLEFEQSVERNGQWMPRRADFVPPLTLMNGSPIPRLSSPDRLAVVAAAGREVFRQSISWALLLDMSDSNPLKNESIEGLMRLSPECRKRIPFQAINEVLRGLQSDTERLWALAIGLADRAPSASGLSRSEDKHFSVWQWATDAGAFRGFLAGTRTYDQKKVDEDRSMYAMDARRYRAEAERARAESNQEQVKFYEQLAQSYEHLAEQDRQWRSRQLNQGTPRDPTPELSTLALAIEGLWWFSLPIAMGSLDTAESCRMPPLRLADVFQWQDFPALQDLVDANLIRKSDPSNFKKQLRTLVLTSAQNTAAIADNHGVRGGLGIRPWLGPFFDQNSFPDRMTRLVLELANETAFNSRGKMTAQSCRETEAVANFALQLGISAPILAPERKAKFIDFDTYRDGARASLAAGVAMATSNRKLPKNAKEASELSVACSNAFIALAHLWSGSFDFNEILHFGTRNGFGSWSGETVHLADAQCKDWNFALQINDASLTEQGRPKDRRYNPPKESFDPRLGPPPSFIFKRDDSKDSQALCGLEKL